jgi:GLPGLI family protein
MEKIDAKLICKDKILNFNMIKTLLIILFSSITINAQIKNITVEYGVVIGEEEKISDKNSGLSEYYKSAMDNAKHLSFILRYANKISFFTDKEEMNDDAHGIAFAKAFSGFIGPVYCDYNENCSYAAVDNRITGKYCLKSPIKKYDWQLTTETKTIEGFLCYKATAKDIVVNPKGTFTFTITAWYCPQIPIAIGPLSLNGLPGLILETERRNVVYGARKITLNAEIAPEIPKPDMKNIKTEEEVQKMRDDFMNQKD